MYWKDIGRERLRYTEIRKVEALKYSLSAGLVLNEKEIKIEVGDDINKLTESLANVIRRLLKE